MKQSIYTVASAAKYPHTNSLTYIGGILTGKNLYQRSSPILAKEIHLSLTSFISSMHFPDERDKTGLTVNSVQYHTALVQLFRPLVHGEFFHDGDQAELKRILLFHARSGVEPLEHAQRLYSARYSMPLASFCLVQLCDALLSYSSQEPSGSETVAFCLRLLQQARAGSALCGPLQWLFSQRAQECGVQISMEWQEIVNSDQEYAVDDVLDACTRLSYVEPLDQIVRYIDSKIANEWNREWEIQIVKRRRGREHLQIDSILNER